LAGLKAADERRLLQTLRGQRDELMEQPKAPERDGQNDRPITDPHNDDFGSDMGGGDALRNEAFEARDSRAKMRGVKARG